MSLARSGERAAAKALKRAGMRILARNYTCPAGEIDIVSRDGDTLVFVEVKTRRSSAVADPEVNVHHHKRRQLTRVARFFLNTHAKRDVPCRFDVVAVVMPDKGKPTIEHFVDALAPA